MYRILTPYPPNETNLIVMHPQYLEKQTYKVKRKKSVGAANPPHLGGDITSSICEFYLRILYIYINLQFGNNYKVIGWKLLYDEMGWHDNPVSTPPTVYYLIFQHSRQLNSSSAPSYKLTLPSNGCEPSGLTSPSQPLHSGFCTLLIQDPSADNSYPHTALHISNSSPIATWSTSPHLILLLHAHNLSQHPHCRTD